MVHGPRKIWQNKFKHAIDFGVEVNWNPSQLKPFKNAVNQHLNATGTRVVHGTYLHGNIPARFHINPNTGLTVVSRMNGRFITGFKASPAQANDILTNFKLF